MESRFAVQQNKKLSATPAKVLPHHAAIHHVCSPRVQPKLAINKPGDQFEQEADRVAEQVMRMKGPKTCEGALVRPGLSENLVQRKCAKCEEEDETLQRKVSGGAGRATHHDHRNAPPLVHEALRSGGQRLDDRTRNFFELRTGYDFGNVRVHTDALAARAANAIEASAFTLGNSIWFGQGMYRPNTIPGRRLLAHELIHTIQQGGRSQRSGNIRVGSVGDAAEVSAERGAEAVITGKSMPNLGASAPVIRRAPKISPVDNDPSLRIVEMDDGSRYRVKRIVDVKPETKIIPGEDPGPSLSPKIDKNNVWLQLNWCSSGKKGDVHSEIKVGADLPAEVKTTLTDIANDIKGGTDPRDAIRKANIKPFASVHIAQSERFSVELSGGPTIKPFDGGVTGGAGKATVRIGDVELSAEVQVTPGAGKSNVQVTGGIKIPLGKREKVTCKRTFLIPKISYQCEKIVPEHLEPRKVPVTRRETRNFYYEYAKADFARRGRTAALDAQDKSKLKQALDEGYRIEAIRGFTSPEGPLGPGKRFEGNQKLSEERAEAAEKWVDGVCPRSVMSMRPSCFAENYTRTGKGELFGATAEGEELVGKDLSEGSVEGFRESPGEEPRRTQDVMEELKKRKTPERQTDTVYPLLRRVDIDISKADVETRQVTVPESREPAQECPADVIRAVADDFDQEKK